MEENLPQKADQELAEKKQGLAEKKDDKPKRFVEKGRDVVFLSLIHI